MRRHLVDCVRPEYWYVLSHVSNCLMADHCLENTSCTTDSTEATGLITSSASLPGLANRILSSETSATAMARFSLELRDLEAAAALEAVGVVPQTQWPSTEALMHELSTDSEVIFRRVLGSAEVLPTRPGVDPLEVTRPLPDLVGPRSRRWRPVRLSLSGSRRARRLGRGFQRRPTFSVL